MDSLHSNVNSWPKKEGFGHAYLLTCFALASGELERDRLHTAPTEHPLSAFSVSGALASFGMVNGGEEAFSDDTTDRSALESKFCATSYEEATSLSVTSSLRGDSPLPSTRCEVSAANVREVCDDDASSPSVAFIVTEADCPTDPDFPSLESLIWMDDASPASSQVKNVLEPEEIASWVSPVDEEDALSKLASSEVGKRVVVAVLPSSAALCDDDAGVPDGKFSLLESVTSWGTLCEGDLEDFPEGGCRTKHLLLMLFEFSFLHFKGT